MNKKYVSMLFIFFYVNLFAFEIIGDPKIWQMEDFIGFDKIGDSQYRGDISSVYRRIEDKKLFLRITFDDMYSRKEKKDFFYDNDIKMALQIKTSSTIFFDEIIDVNNIIKNESSYYFLRTPEHNLIELIVDWPIEIIKENLVFDISIIYNDKKIDQFIGSGIKNSNGGNVAFVHHGNQGLTYSEVFYGQEPSESSGFDEILEVHQASETPGNFHLSGTLMPAAEWHNPEFNDWLESGVTEGYVAMLTSALGQHMMPFVHNDMNDWSVSIETDMVEYRYGYVPKVAWVPERVWLEPDSYPEAGVIDWLGDNWEQHGVEAVILDDYIHCPNADNKKIHYMNNAMGINLRVIPINNEFVGMMHYDADGAKNYISSTGQYGITVYGTDWEVVAEMNEHHETSFLDNYESVLWYCKDNFPAINVWKLDAALNNSDFNGNGIEIQNGTYGLLGGTDGYGGSNNSWYSNWAATPSLSDFHDPKWNYGTVWNDAYNNLMTAPNNSLAQLGWYTLMINLHETGWHEEGEVAGWEHHYSSHIKNANVYVEAAKWANGDYTETNAAYFSDIDHDGGDELIMHNDKVFAVFEGVGGRISWLFYSDGNGSGYSVVGSDVAYYSETNGDYNEGSHNHVAALSDAYPHQEDQIYNIEINIPDGDNIQATLSLGSVTKIINLSQGNNYLDVQYQFSEGTVWIKSGWTPDLLDLIWSGKSHLQRIFGEYASYHGYRNSTSGATAALVLGSGGAGHHMEYEGTLVKVDQIYGTGIFNFYLFAGHTSEPYDEYMNKIVELDELASGLVDDFGPRLISAVQVAPNTIHLFFSDYLESESTTNISNYLLSETSESVGIQQAYRLYGRKVVLILDNNVSVGAVEVTGLLDLSGNTVDPLYNSIDVETLAVNPHLVGTFNNWDPSDHNYDLTLNENGIWEVDLDVSANDTTFYKVIESDDWDDNDWPGTNQYIIFDIDTTITVKANCGFNTGVRNWDEFVTHLDPVIVGNFFEMLGVGNNWDLNSMVGVMDDDGDGTFSWEVLVPEGDWEWKIVLNRSWDQDLQGGGGNFYVSSDMQYITFHYDFRHHFIYMTWVLGECNVGDMNTDGNYNVLDIVALANCVLAQTCSDNGCAADLNADGNFNVLDIVALANCVLAQTCE